MSYVACVAEFTQQPPATIGPYKVIRPLARGGMAAVYEVQDETTGEHFALKLLTHKGMAAPRFNREYRALTRLDHPNIIRVYRFGVDGDSPFLTMELLDGVAAQVYAKSCGRPGTPWRTAEVTRVVALVADALAYMHERGIVHRDLKSSNVMVLNDRAVKLLDFGTARLLGTSDEITRHGEFVGTFAYASPEQLTGGTVDARSDIYSLGVLTYRLLTGKRPFEADNPHALARLHLEHTPRAPDAVVARIPPALSALVMKLLLKPPEERPSSAAEVAAQLRHGLEPAGRPEPVQPNTPSLVGRTAELRGLRAAIEKARPGRMVIVSGPPGSGRRRLLEHAAEEAKQRGWKVLDAEFPGPPGLGAVAEVVRKAARGLSIPAGEGPDLSGLGTIYEGSTSTAASSHLRVFQAAAALLERRVAADQKPLALVLHDLQLAGPLALQALRALRAHFIERNVTVIVLCSCTEEGDGPRSVLRRFFPDGIRMPLQPLGPDDVGRLVGGMLGRKAPPAILSRRIHEATGGLPGYVEEIVRAMIQEGMVEPRRTKDDRVAWMDRSGGRIVIPASVGDALQLRIDRMSKIELRVMEALAVAGGEARLDTLAHACDMDTPEARVAMASLVAAGMIAHKEQAETWRFRLGLTGQLVGERIRASRRNLLQRRLADALQDAPPTAHKIAVMVEAGKVHQAVADALVWAEQMIEGRRTDELPATLGRVVEASQQVEGIPVSQDIHLSVFLARALGMQDPKDPRAEALLERARALAVDRVLGIEVDLERANLVRRRGDATRADEILQTARDALHEDDDVALWVRSWLDLGSSRIFAGNIRGALVAFDEARAASVKVGDLATEGQACIGCGIAHFTLGRLDEAEEDLDRARHVLTDVGDDTGQWHAAMNLADVLRVQGRLTEAVQLIDPHLEDARQRAISPYRYAGLLANLAESQIELYRLGEVRELLSELDSIQLKHPYMQAASAMVRGRMCNAALEHDKAVAVLEPAVVEAERHALPVMAHQMRAYLGEALARSGQRERGLAEIDRAVASLQAEDHLTQLGEACISRSRALGKHGDPVDAFAPILGWIQKQPARLVAFEYHLSSTEFWLARGDTRRGYSALTEARRVWMDIRALLGPEEVVALDVHPWAARLARCESRI